MTNTVADIEFTDETRQQINQLGGWLNYSQDEVVVHAISKLYWEVAPDEMKAQTFYERRDELRDLLQKGMDKISNLDAGETVSGLEGLNPEQISVIKKWLMDSWANIDLLEIFVETADD
jgi:hypothetical protein